ncbi:MAG: VWA domain-containing protein [Myxococcota bacterium]
MRVALPLLSLALILAVGPALAAGAQASRRDSPRLLLTIETPPSGAVIGDPGGMAFIAGKALALYGALQTFDIMFVIDASESTSAPSGADIDGDGRIGRRRGEQFLSVLGKILPLPNTDQGDSVLAAEVAAVRVLLDQLDPRTTRVGVVYFSGDHEPLTPDAFTQVPLTTDYRKVERGLDEILELGPHGMTNMVTAVNLATVELLGTRSAYSTRREGSRRIIIFLTDGRPTLPLPSSLQNARMAISKAFKAAKHGIRIDTYAIGKDALSEPVVVVEMARVTEGVFTPILHPKNLRTVFEEVNFADIDELIIRNITTGELAAYRIQNPDGTFAALVPMKEGVNTLEVSAHSSDGTYAQRQVTVRFLEDVEMQELTPRELAQRNRLLENRLLDLQRRNLKIQLERDEELRRELALEIEQQRQQARERSAEMRKALELEVED